MSHWIFPFLTSTKCIDSVDSDMHYIYYCKCGCHGNLHFILEVSCATIVKLILWFASGKTIHLNSAFIFTPNDEPRQLPSELTVEEQQGGAHQLKIPNM